MLRVSLALVFFYLGIIGASAASKPNIIVFLVDDARVDDLSTMPVARSIAEGGANFVNAYSSFPLCCPARASLLTGQYSHNHGVQSNKAPTGGFTVFHDARTLATWMDPAYITAWAGKYFNEYGVNGTASYVPPGWDEWFVPDGSVWNYAETNWSHNGTLQSFPGQYQMDTEGDFLVDFVNRNAKKTQPFFVVASFLAPHNGMPFEDDDPNLVYGTTNYPTPYVGPRHRNDLSTLPLKLNPAINEDTSDKPFSPLPLASWEFTALKEVNQQRRESLLFVEDAMRRVLKALRTNAIFGNTYIVFLSDNGYALGEHRVRNGKTIPYGVAVKVPIAMRGPGIKPGSIVHRLIGIHDLAPTILDMAGRTGAQGNFPIDGASVLPMLNYTDYLRGRALVLEGAPPNGEIAPDWYFRGVVTQSWKYLERPLGAVELYDLKNDPWELENHAGQPAYAVQQAAMKALKGRLQDCKGTDCLK